MGSAVTESIGKDGQTVRTVKEGKATILVPESAEVKEDRDKVQQVFYNPIQQYNRDLSVLAIKVFGEQSLEQKHQAFLKSTKSRHNRKRKRGEAEPAAVAEQEALKPEDAEKANGGEANADHEHDVQGPHADDDVHKPTFKILDALSASGLRALRYGHELPFVTSITANDLSPTAAESIRQNVKHNELEDVIQVSEGDALGVMYRAIADDLSVRDSKGQPSKHHKFDVVDLDTYGSSAPFFDAAVQSVRDDGGLLAITCTDSALWAGHCYTEKSYALYGGIPTKGLHSHEAGLRLIIHAVASSAARYGLHVEPQLSLSIDYYTKLFIKITKAPAAVKFHGSKTMLVYTCDTGCSSWVTQPLLKAKLTENKRGSALFYKHGMHLGPTTDRACQHCGGKMHLSGPMYSGPIHSQDFVESLLDEIPKADSAVYETLPRLEGMLSNVLAEFFLEPEKSETPKSKEATYAAIDEYPFFFMPSRLASILSCVTPPEDSVRGALIHMGYRVGTSHCRPGSIKTNAPWSTIWSVYVEWIRQQAPIKTEKLKSTMPGWKILNDRGFFEDRPKQTTAEQPVTDGDVAMSESTVSKPDEATAGDTATEGAPLSEAELLKTLVFNIELATLGRKSRPQGVLRYQFNPRSHWGPLSKAAAR